MFQICSQYIKNWQEPLPGMQPLALIFITKIGNAEWTEQRSAELAAEWSVVQTASDLEQRVTHPSLDKSSKYPERFQSWPK